MILQGLSQDIHIIQEYHPRSIIHKISIWMYVCVLLKKYSKKVKSKNRHAKIFCGNLDNLFSVFSIKISRKIFYIYKKLYATMKMYSVESSSLSSVLLLSEITIYSLMCLFFSSFSSYFTLFHINLWVVIMIFVFYYTQNRILLHQNKYSERRFQVVFCRESLC